MLSFQEKIVETVSLPQQIARILSDTIKSGKIKPGAVLPTEKQLAENYSVSRSVVREAISILKYDGLVESKQGAGVFVSLKPLSSSFRIEMENSGDSKKLASLFELRMYVESAAAGLAATHRTEQQLGEMAASLEVIRTCIANEQADSEESIQADIKFHTCISQASDNVYFFTFIQFLNDNLRSSIEAGRKNSATIEGRASDVLKEHEAILAAVTNKDVSAATSAMRRHILNSANRLHLKF